MTRHIILDRLINRHLQKLKKRNNGDVSKLPEYFPRILEEFKMVSVFPMTLAYIEQRWKNIQRYQERLEYLKKNPGIPQHSPEWHRVRGLGMITASTFADACGFGFGSFKDFLRKKCGYEKPEPFSEYALKIMNRGTMLEQVATNIYEKRFNIKVHELGLLIDEDNPTFGASPDGCTELGIALELKSPDRRDINGKVPDKYYAQIMGQLAIMQLDECDYFETGFIDYDNGAEFYSDWDESGLFTKKLRDKGIIIEYYDKTADKQKYIYSDFEKDKKYFYDWETTNYKILDEDPNVGDYQSHYWYLEKVNLLRIYRDDVFIKNMFDMLERVSDKIEAYKADRALYDREVARVPAVKKYPEKTSTIDIDTSCLGFPQEMDLTSSTLNVNYANTPQLGIYTKSPRAKKKPVASKGFMMINDPDDTGNTLNVDSVQNTLSGKKQVSPKKTKIHLPATGKFTAKPSQGFLFKDD